MTKNKKNNTSKPKIYNLPYTYLTLLQMVIIALANGNFKISYQTGHTQKEQPRFFIQEYIMFISGETFRLKEDETDDINASLDLAKEKWEEGKKDARNYMEHLYPSACSAPDKARKITTTILELDSHTRERIINALFTKTKIYLETEIEEQYEPFIEKPTYQPTPF